MRTAGLEPALSLEKQIFVPLRLSPPPNRGVRGLDYPFAMPQPGFRRRPSSLYTFPAEAGLGSGSARFRTLAFPEFERFYSRGFHLGTPMKSAASTDFATSA